MKKTLALVLALAMVFSTITVAFAEGTIGAEAQVCADLGMLKGETGTVDAAYTATAPTRLQSAVMFLRLKGLEAEALAFTGEENFADGNIAWAEGANLLAYLKANPQLGWQGDGTNFNPNGAITAKEYYKVLLEALGYKQTTPEVVGDFGWDNVLEFAAEKGLSKVAAVANYTVNDLAIATVEALKAEMKEGGKTLVASLVEAGKIDAAKATEAGLVAGATDSEAKLELAQVLGNTKVLAQFDAEVEKAFAENVANFKIVEKGTTTEVEVTAAVLDGTKQVVLETASLTAGKAYTLTVGDVSMNFAGVAKDSTVPEIDDVEGTDTERVVVTYTTSMDMATALDAANYAIAGVTVKSVAWDDSKDRDAVELTTEGLTTNKTYKVTVSGVKSIDGVILKSASKNFVAKSDKKAPVLDSASAMTNTRILVKFTDDNELTAESAENIANYQITYGSKDANSLNILSAKLVEDNDDDLKWVELTTESQKTSQKYTLKVNNITDTSVLANAMTKEKEKTFYGVKVDTKEPSFISIRFISDEIIIAEFSDKSRLDFTSAQDINNYEINNDATIESVEMKDASDPDCTSVKVKVGGILDKTSYKLTASDIADEYGNIMEATSKSKTYKSEDNSVATVTRVVAEANDTFVVIFDKELDEASAEDVANYSINEDVGSPRKATYDSSDSDYGSKATVTLKTTDLKANASYKLTINGVKDEADRVLTSLTAKFVVATDENDYEKPEIEDVEVVNNKVIRVTFTEPMDTGASDLTLSNGWDADFAIAYDDEDVVLEYTVVGHTFTGEEEDIRVTAVTTTDVAGNAVVLPTGGYDIGTNGDSADLVEVDSYDQVSVKKFQIQFSEKINLAASALTKTGDDYFISDMKSGASFEVITDDDDDSIVYLKKVSGKMADDTMYYFDVSKLKNYHGIAVQNPDEYNNVENKCLALDAYILDEEAPYIESVEAVHREKIEVQFNEELANSGQYKLKYYDEKKEDDAFIGVTPEIDSDDESLVVLVPAKKLEGRYVYTLIQLSTKAKDLSNNAIEADTNEEIYDFVGTDIVAVGDYISGVKVINGTKIEVYTNKAQSPTVAVAVYSNDTNITGTLARNSDNNKFTVKLAEDTGIPVYALSEDKTYRVVVGTRSFEFKGVVEDAITVTGSSTDDEYTVTFDDSEENDEVIFVHGGSVIAQDTVLSEGGSVTIDLDTILAKDPVVKTGDTITDDGTDDIISVIVMRGNVVVYYKTAYDLSDGE